MNYTLDFNSLNQLEIPRIFLCTRNKDKLGELFPVEDLVILMNFNTFHEVSFTIRKTLDGLSNPLWDKIKDLKLVFVENFGYYEISVLESHDGSETKNIAGKSIEVELGQVYLNAFQINSDELEDSEYKEVVTFYNPTKPTASLLHLIMAKCPAWSIGHVDEILWSKQRTFDTDNTAIYDFLTGEVSEQFSCVFQFDTFLREISCYDGETVGNDTTAFLNQENFLNEFSIEADSDQIKNCFKILGGEGILINEVNPNGSDYLWSISDADKADMSPSLVEKLASYDTLYESKKKEFEETIKALQAQMVILQDLKHKAPEVPEEPETPDKPVTPKKLAASDKSVTPDNLVTPDKPIATDSPDVTEKPDPPDKPVDPEDTDPDLTKLSLAYLLERESALTNLETVYKEAGFGATTHPNYTDTYLKNHTKLEAVKKEIIKRNTDITNATTKYKELETKRNNIQSSLDLEKHLGTQLWLELSLYRRENIFSNDNYSVTSLTTDEERFLMEKDLYAEAVKEIEKAKNPNYNISTSLNNILAIPTLQEQNIKHFRLGNFIRIGISDTEIKKARIMSYQIDFNNLEQIEIELSDMIKWQDTVTDMQTIVQQAQQASTDYNTIKKQYDKTKDTVNFVEEMKKEGLNAATVDIINSQNQEILLNERGLSCRKWNPEKKDYELEEIQIINNKLVMTDDGWRSARLALGKINYNGTLAYGLVADVLIGDLVATKTLHISNQNNSFVLDENGAVLTNADLTVTNGRNTVKISPSGDSCFEILKGTVKKIYMDAEGNANFDGKLKAATGVFSGEVSGGSININNTFTVDKNGNMIAQSGTFKGDISGSKITGTTITGGTVTGTNINGGTLTGSAIIGGTIVGSNVTSTGNGCEARLSDGNLFLSGYNGYVRFGSPQGYQKLIGVSGVGNLVIGHDGETDSIYNGEKFNNVNFYGSNFNFKENKNGGVVNLSVSGHVNAKSMNINTSLIVNSSTVSLNGHSHSSTDISPVTTSYNNVRIGSVSCAAVSYVQEYFAYTSWVQSNFQPKGSSDFRLKKDIFSLESSNINDFYMNLKPKSYRFKDCTENNKIHSGLLAQQIINNFSKHNMNWKDYDLIEEYNNRTEKDEGMYTGQKSFRVNYDNLHAYHITMVQSLQRQIDILRAELVLVNKSNNFANNNTLSF